MGMPPPLPFHPRQRKIHVDTKNTVQLVTIHQITVNTTLLENPAYNQQYLVHAPSHEDPL